MEEPKWIHKSLKNTERLSVNKNWFYFLVHIFRSKGIDNCTWNWARFPSPSNKRAPAIFWSSEIFKLCRYYMSTPSDIGCYECKTPPPLKFQLDFKLSDIRLPNRCSNTLRHTPSVYDKKKIRNLSRDVSQTFREHKMCISHVKQKKWFALFVSFFPNKFNLIAYMFQNAEMSPACTNNNAGSSDIHNLSPEIH